MDYSTPHSLNQRVTALPNGRLIVLPPDKPKQPSIKDRRQAVLDRLASGERLLTDAKGHWTWDNGEEGQKGLLGQMASRGLIVGRRDGLFTGTPDHAKHNMCDQTWGLPA